MSRDTWPGRVGVWLGRLGVASAAEEHRAAAAVEEMGYAAIWVGETAVNKEVFTHAALLLAATRRIAVATGIANIWARDATATNAAALALGEAYPGRFLLGLGVSHPELVSARGHVYGRPLAAMRSYLSDMDNARYAAPRPKVPVRRVLAALGPRMLELSRDRADGAHTYFVPPDHTRDARAVLGPVPLLVPEQAVVLEKDPGRARSIARHYMAFYLRQPSYLRSLRRLGFTDEDLADGGSRRLVDRIVAWGDPDTVADRLREHLESGASQVAVQPLAPDVQVTIRQLREIAPAVIEL